LARARAHSSNLAAEPVPGADTGPFVDLPQSRACLGLALVVHRSGSSSTKGVAFNKIGCGQERRTATLSVMDHEGSKGTVESRPPPLVLRSLRPGDETAARAAHAELATDGCSFVLDLRRDEPWASYLARLELLRTGAGVPDGWVPGTFLVAEVSGELVGRTSIRHRLNPWLAQWGGHIGYAVRPGSRRRGYATEILRQSLVIAKARGINRVLITCDEGNLASAAVIEHCGGVLADIVPGEGGSPAKRRYWVEHEPAQATRPI
jgi:predicted acetyltransferase